MKKIKVGSKQVTIKGRFFILLVLFLALIGFGLKQAFFKGFSGVKKDVLAVSTDPYTLHEEQANSQNPKTNSRLYEPVTIAVTVKTGDTLDSLAKEYHADPQTILDYPYNNVPDNLQLTVGQSLIIPNGYIDGEAPPPPPIPIGTGQFAWPVHGVITQYMSWFHPGAIDIAIDLGTPVKAADDGTVIDVEHEITGYGNHVIVSHGDGLTSLYAHLSQTKVTKGQGVRKGDLIGLSGSTGRSTGPHLHFEVRRNNSGVDPMSLLPRL